jgi:hypothetical protein
MPHQPERNPEPAPEPKVRLSTKVIIVVLVIIVVEAGILLGVALMTSAPAVVASLGFAEDEEARLNTIVEIPVVADRFPNNKQGVLFLYDTRITAQVKKRYQPQVEAFIKQNQARIRTMIGAIWRNADPRHFDEPLLNTLTRQVHEAMHEIIPVDAATGEHPIQGILLEGVTPYRAGF